MKAPTETVLKVDGKAKITREKLDNDSFRRNLGDAESAYQQIMERVSRA